MPDRISEKQTPKVLILASPAWGGAGGGNRQTAYNVYQSSINIEGLAVCLDDVYGNKLRTQNISTASSSKVKKKEPPKEPKKPPLNEAVKSAIYQKYPEIAESYETHRVKDDPILSERNKNEDRRLKELIGKEKPTAICCFPPIPIERVQKALNANNMENVPIVAVISDFSHGIFARWTQGAAAVIVPTEESRLTCIQSHKMPPEKVYNYGFFVNKAQIQSIANSDKSELRSQLSQRFDNRGNSILPSDLPENEPVLLLTGGSKGLGGMSENWEALNTLYKKNRSFHLVTVTGDNPELYDELTRMNEKRPAEYRMKNTILGICENEDMLKLTHTIGFPPMGKLGARFGMETVPFGKPVVIAGSLYEPGLQKRLELPKSIELGEATDRSAGDLPGIERGNEEFMLKHGFASKADTPEELIGLVEAGLDDPSIFSLKGNVDIGGADKTAVLLKKLAFGEELELAPKISPNNTDLELRRMSWDGAFNKQSESIIIGEGEELLRSQGPPDRSPYVTNYLPNNRREIRRTSSQSKIFELRASQRIAPAETSDLRRKFVTNQTPQTPKAPGQSTAAVQSLGSLQDAQKTTMPPVSPSAPLTDPAQKDVERQIQNAPATPLRPSTPREAIATRTTANEDGQQTEPTSSRRLAGLQNAFQKGKGVWQRGKASFRKFNGHLKGGSRRGGGGTGGHVR